MFLAIGLVTAAYADVVQVPDTRDCAGECADGTAGTWCPGASPECAQLLRADGWSERCAGNDGYALWCPAEASGWCATVGFGEIGVAAVLIAIAITRRRAREA